MKIVFFGAGAVGSYFGAMLSKVCEVALVGRKDHVRAVADGGLCVTIGGKEEIFKPLAFERIEKAFDALGNADFVFMTCKSFDTAATAMALAASGTGKETGTEIVSFQNGLGNVEIIREETGMPAWAASTTYGMTFSGPGRIILNGTGDLFVGPPTDSMRDRARTLSDLFVKAGLNSKSLPPTEMKEYMWKKALVNSAINPITALARVKNGAILDDKGLNAVSRKAALENLYLAHLAGRLRDFSEKDAWTMVETVARNTASNTSSMLQDVLKGGRTEIDAINGYFLMLSRNPDAQAPVNSALVRLIKGMDPSARF